MVCMTDRAMSSIWPMRSRNSSCMCSGLMNDSAIARNSRQRQQHVAGQAAVRGVDPHLAQDLEALADDVGEVLENLGQVAAGLALDQHRGRRRTARRAAECGPSGSSSASFSGRPKFCSSKVFRNSGPTGSGISSATIFKPVAKAWPALSARDTRSSASGNSSSNARSRRVRLIAQDQERQREPEQRRQRSSRQRHPQSPPSPTNAARAAPARARSGARADARSSRPTARSTRQRGPAGGAGRRMRSKPGSSPPWLRP